MEQKETEVEPTNSLSLEWVYMHGMHSRVQGYKTVTLWTYPGMNKVMALAIVECQNENTQMIKHFLQTFNKCLQHYTGIDDYKFDPYGIMCDEGGANMNAIEEVFGKEFMACKRVVTGQWHFKSCARRQLQGIDKDFFPNKKAKHRVPKHYNLNNPTQKKKETKSKNQVEQKKVKGKERNET